jgi:hypothetical protein
LWIETFFKFYRIKNGKRKGKSGARKGVRSETHSLFQHQNHKGKVYIPKYEVKDCKNVFKNITPTLPSPLRGGELGWGGKFTKNEILLASIKSVWAT